MRPSSPPSSPTLDSPGDALAADLEALGLAVPTTADGWRRLGRAAEMRAEDLMGAAPAEIGEAVLAWATRERLRLMARWELELFGDIDPHRGADWITRNAAVTPDTIRRAVHDGRPIRRRFVGRVAAYAIRDLLREFPGCLDGWLLRQRERPWPQRERP
jgi:hypothetical protein